MTDNHASRQFVLTRLGAPAARLPGESVRHRSPGTRRVYCRYAEYVDEAHCEARPRQALEDFVAFLEGERDHDYEAFDFGRELLLADLCVRVEQPSADPEPPQARDASPVPTRRRPRWSRRKRGRGHDPARSSVTRMRARVLERLGWPHPHLPGEYIELRSSRELDEVRAYFDRFDHQAITPALVDEATERLAALRGSDWQAFCYGRRELLSLLEIPVDVPRPC